MHNSNNTMEHRNSLQAGYVLREFTINRILGQGGTGITYLAHDNKLKRNVAIKEYLPMEMAVRNSTNSWIEPVSGEYGESFSSGLGRFMREAETLAQLWHPNIVRAHGVFSENNTAYIVMDYCAGVTLDIMLRNRNKLNQSEFLNIMLPIMDGLEYMHDNGYIHRDIKPANLFIQDNGEPLILDFGSTRESLIGQTGLMTRMVSPGYAPFEQYTGKKFNQGPWTDIYGLGATMYKSISGRAPADAMDRGNALLLTDKDIYVSLLDINPPGYSGNILRAIDQSLAFKPSNRPSYIADWRLAFESGAILDRDVTGLPHHEISGGKIYSHVEAEAVTVCK